MQIIDSKLFPERNIESLKKFLVHCQSIAKEKSHFQIASISLNIFHIDPLAVIQSIHDTSEFHFYIERTASETALAGADAAVSATFQGPERFTKVKEFANNILENTILFGDLDYPYTGPHFCTGFSFFDTLENSDSSFPPATVFLPIWQVAKDQGVYSAVANIRINPNSDIDQLTEKVWLAHKKFSAYDYTSPNTQTPKITEQQNVGGNNWFPTVVKKAITEIDAGLYKKIVLARAVDLKTDTEFHPLESLNRLREDYPSCYCISFANEKGKSFIAATPEQLIKVENQKLFTEALAGSAKRGQTAKEDAEYGASLLKSNKDLHENQLVIDSITGNLKKLGISPLPKTSPRLLQLPNVQHIKTPIEADLGTNVHILDAAQALHPTPAVGGVPLDVAQNSIQKLENFDRGLYAGVVGWFNYKGDGQMVVAIRSALIEKNTARLYSGCGIVKGSDPEKEKAESDLKLNALLQNFKTS